jgi:hypothetical protein
MQVWNYNTGLRLKELFSPFKDEITGVGFIEAVRVFPSTLVSVVQNHQ